MKRTLTIFVITSILIFALTSCGQLNKPLPKAVTGDQKVLFDTYDEDLPIAVCRSEFRVDGVHDMLLYDEEAVLGVIKYLENITVGKKSNIMYADAGTCYTFYYGDGRTVYFSMEPGQININGQAYTFTAQSTLKVTFPFDDASLSACHLHPTWTTFFSRVELPVEVRIESDGTTVAVTDREKIDRLCDCLGGTGMRYAYSDQYANMLNDPQLPERVYTFVMGDGTEYVFRFVGDYLQVDYPEPFGTWAYYIDMYMDEALN